jgi:hypothetical protein
MLGDPDRDWRMFYGLAFVATLAVFLFALVSLWDVVTSLEVLPVLVLAGVIALWNFVQLIRAVRGALDEGGWREAGAETAQDLVHEIEPVPASSQSHR